MTISDIATLRLDEHGAQFFRGAVAHDIAPLDATLSHLPSNLAGIRLNELGNLRPFLQVNGSIGSIAKTLIGPQSRAVRAILFDKSRERNWSLTWHQDRTICVKQRIDVDGFGPWTRKGGMQHVAPPFDILSRMVTLRVHLDDVPAHNAPLLIAPGSHLEGRVSENAIQGVVKKLGVLACLATTGDVWAYATPILHASEAASALARRRVLQVDFAAEDLPCGLEWLEV